MRGRPDATFSDAARRALESYSWPGNARELRNAIEGALVFAATDTLEPENFPEAIRAAISGIPVSLSELRSLEEIERQAIAATLEATRYRITRAADILGISRKTLLEKRKKYGLK